MYNALSSKAMSCALKYTEYASNGGLCGKVADKMARAHLRSGSQKRPGESHVPYAQGMMLQVLPTEAEEQSTSLHEYRLSSRSLLQV